MGGPAPIPAQVGKLPRFLSLEVPPSSSCTSGPANDDSQPSRAKDPRGGLFARQPTSIYSRHKGLKLLFEKGDRRKVHRTMRTRSNAYSLALKRRRRSVTDETASWTGRLVGGQGIPAGGRYRPRAAGDLQRVARRKRRPARSDLGRRAAGNSLHLSNRDSCAMLDSAPISLTRAVREARRESSPSQAGPPWRC